MKKIFSFFCFTWFAIGLFAQPTESALEVIEATTNVATISSFHSDKLSGALRQLVWIEETSCFVFGDDQAVYGYDKTCRLQWTIKARQKIEGWVVSGNDLYVMDGSVLGQYDIKSFQGTEIGFPINAVNFTNGKTFTHYSNSESKDKYKGFFNKPAFIKYSPPIVVNDKVYVLSDENKIWGLRGNLTLQSIQTYSGEKHPAPSELRLYHLNKDGLSYFCFPTWEDKIVFIKLEGKKFTFDRTESFRATNYKISERLKVDPVFSAPQKQRLGQYLAQMMPVQPTVESPNLPYLPYHYTVTQLPNKNKQIEQLLFTKYSSSRIDIPAPPITLKVFLVSADKDLPVFNGNTTSNLPSENTNIHGAILSSASGSLKQVCAPYVLQKDGASYAYFLLTVNGNENAVQLRQYKLPTKPNAVMTKQWKQNWKDDQSIAKLTKYNFSTLVERSRKTSAFMMSSLPCAVPVSSSRLLEAEKRINFAEMPKALKDFLNSLVHRKPTMDFMDRNSKVGLFRLYSTLNSPPDEQNIVDTYCNKYKQNGQWVYPLDSIRKQINYVKNTLPESYNQLLPFFKERKKYWINKRNGFPQGSDQWYGNDYVVQSYDDVIEAWNWPKPKYRNGFTNQTYQFRQQCDDFAARWTKIVNQIQYYGEKYTPLEIWYLSAPYFAKP